MGQMNAVYILASLIPSMRVYRHIARKLEECAGSNHRFTTWISMYASEAFDISINGLENLLDRLAIEATKKRVRNIYRVYNRALQLVVDMFFGLSEPSLIPLILRYPDTTLFCGFDLFATQPDNAADGTDDTAAYNDDGVGWCSTFFDSTSALVRPFERINEKANEKQANDKYEECVKALHDASLQHSEKYQLGIQAITPIIKMPYSATYLQEQLQRLSDTETETNNQLIMSKLLKGLEEKDVERFGKYFAFKSTACFHLLNEFGKRANVISSCWCGANILQKAFHSVVSKDVGLYANQLLFREGKSTGAFETHIQSAGDKLQIFQAQVEKNGGFTVFVGDAINDILCLTKANLGVVVNRSSGLLSVACQFGLQTKTLYSGLLDRVRELKSKDEVESTWMPESGIIYTSSWRELCLSFFGEDKPLDGVEDGCLDGVEDGCLDGAEDGCLDVDDDEDLENDDD